MSAVPLPLRAIRGRFEPMTGAEARYWTASHAAWVEVWNRHERDRSLPLGPEWPEAQTLAWISGPQSALAFIVRETSRWGVMRFRDFRVFHPGWSSCRNAADIDKLVWAGWRVRP